MPTLERKYIYKVFEDGSLIGVIPPSLVVSDFRYHQEIDTGAAETVIEISRPLPISDEDIENIIDENANDIVDEYGSTIDTAYKVSIIGEAGSGMLIANGNDIQIWEVSDDNPNGVQVFAGYISQWDSVTESGNENITVTVLSYGKDLEDYIYGNESFSLQVTQAAYNDWFRVGNSSQWVGGINTVLRSVMQTISGHSFTLTKVRLHLAVGHNLLGIYPASVLFTLGIYEGSVTGASTLIATSQATVTSQVPVFADTDFILDTPVVLLPTGSYFFKVTANDYGNVACQSLTNPYSGGALYTEPASGSISAPDSGTWDNKFWLYSGTLETDADFNDTDPSDIVREALDGYNDQGGVVTYTADSIDDTGYQVDYTFRTSTVKEIIEKARELAPANWRWRVDPASNVLYFKQPSSTADHLFILGKHIGAFRLGGSIEHIKNVVYFTGGPTAGVNLLKQYTNPSSLAKYRRGMIRLNDNRILAANEPAAEIISESYMDENNAEVFRTRGVNILAESYNISTINPGDTAKFVGLGGFVDGLVLLITAVDRNADFVNLTLGKIPQRSDSIVDKLKRDLDKEQTLDNPSAPS